MLPWKTLLVRACGRAIEQSRALEEIINSKAVTLLVGLVMGLMVTSVAQAAPGKPNFTAALYGDGALWGTKGTTELPAPNANNTQSFDKLFVIINGAPGQLPVSEAAPGNPDYNGGRWFTHTVMWTLGEPTVLMSYDDVMYHYGLGELCAAGSFDGGPADYFQCPLLPVK
jgi:hypothetical protein